jgi:threonine dehydratase
MVTLDKIYHASFVLKDIIRKTDMIYAPKINPECEVYLKTENLQVTGSFKVRGAAYKISQLSAEEKAKGVIACSAGNHAQGVALAATTTEICSKLKFGRATAEDEVLYKETAIAGEMAVMENRAGEDTQLNIELLFNAVTADRKTINNLFNR